VAEKAASGRKSETPDGLWSRCDGCGEILYRKTLESNSFVCNRCGFHFRISPVKYIEILLDDGRLDELDAGLEPADPLGFPDYARKLKDQREKSGRVDGLVYGRGSISGCPVVLAVMDFGFIGGSMGSVVGEKVARAIRLARAERRPLLIVAMSGGARMQEGILSLMQMAKTSAELGLLRRDGVPYIALPVDPCTGGVSASFAMLGDVIVSEPGALIGFAGRRTIEGTIGEKLPEGFQTAEFCLKHGTLDAVVPRRDLKDAITKILAVLWPKSKYEPRPV
jgi:acetyl-CoA carboxylase carboxyl transferase subunit beta